MELKNIKNASIQFKDFMNHTFLIITKNSKEIIDYNSFLEKVCCMLSNIIYKLNYLEQSVFVETILYLDNKVSTKRDVEDSINIKKIQLELFYYIINNIKHREYDEIKQIYTTLENTIDIKQTHNYFKDTSEMPKLTETVYFKNLIKTLDEII